MPAIRIATVLLLAAAPYAAFADVRADREYLFGDDSTEQNDFAVASGNAIIVTYDSADPADPNAPTGALFLDLNAFGGPLYQASDRPGADAGTFSVLLDGVDDRLEQAVPLDIPDVTWDNPTNFPNLDYGVNYTGLLSRGVQFWAKPSQEGLAAGLRQDLINDATEHGVFIDADGNWGMEFDNFGFQSNTPAVGGEWVHVMAVTGYDDPTGRSATGAALWINGVAVAASEDDTADGELAEETDSILSIGASLPDPDDGSFTNFYSGELDDLTMFVWGDNSSEQGDPAGQDFGSFNLLEDNPVIAAALAGAPAADVNLDGVVSGDGTGPAASDDVTAFVEGWRFETQVPDSFSNVPVAVGDLISRQNGDLNLDGRVDLRDWIIVNNAEPELAVGIGQALGFISTIPEPSALALAASLVALGHRRRR